MCFIIIANFLFAQQVKAIVVACNTASSVALEALNKKYSIPVLNVIDPSVFQAVSYSKSKTIGVIGTETTILSRTYQKKINKINAEIEVVTQACPLFVPIIEEGLINKQFSLSFEIEFKKTFYDFLDNTSGANTSNINNVIYKPNTSVVKNYQYGSGNNNDFYYFTGISISYIFYKIPCPKDSAPYNSIY